MRKYLFCYPFIKKGMLSCLFKIGKEARAQFQERTGKLPDVVVACVGGGSNAIGMFHPFVGDKGVRLVGVEAAGEGVATGKHCATCVKGTPGVLHGTRTLLLQVS